MHIFRFRLVIGLLAGLLAAPAFALTEFEGEVLRSIRKAREAAEPAKALMLADLLVEKSPQLSSGYYERASLLLEAGRAADARRDIDKSVALTPQWAAAFLLRAKIRAAGFDYAGALEDADQAGRGSEPVEFLGHMLLALGRHAEALTCFEYLMKGQFGPYTNARFPRALSLAGLGRTAEAADWFQGEYQDNGNIAARFQVILAYCQLGRFAEAEKNLATWLEPGAEPAIDYEREAWKALRDNRDAALYLGGVVRFAQDDFKGAVAQLDQVQPADELSDDARLLRHAALVRMKRPDDALKAKGELKDAWTRVLGRYLQGGMTEKDLLKAAADSPDLVVRRERECAAGFFAGQVRLAAGDDLAASLLFEKAEATKAIDSAVYALTKVARKAR